MSRIPLSERFHVGQKYLLDGALVTVDRIYTDGRSFPITIRTNDGTSAELHERSVDDLKPEPVEAAIIRLEAKLDEILEAIERRDK